MTETTTAHPRRLTRSTDERWIAGVAGGVARHFDLDPVLVRVAFAALALLGPGLLLYVLMWALVPPDDAPPELSTARSALRAVVVLLALAAAAMLGLGAG